ncbi:MAG: polysaccharide pyruvyl transferase family protein [Lachnospiraceae bacterium]|nr:polysaccharide pyruvyl transferase family protein [Lachnospiraceae bacterium]
MKYANIVFDGNRKTSVNIGDDLQIVAIEYIYRKMGIEEKDIVRIGFSELAKYDGEYVILPISFPMHGYREGVYITMFSPKIIPVFLGLSIMSDNITEEEVAYLRRFEPIGCRDHYTMDILRKKNILSYVGGCVTALLPKLDDVVGDKVYVIDVPEAMRRYIPSAIKKDAIYISQILLESDNPNEDAKKRLIELAKNARMIITTRLHSALPCTALGIPVVLLKKNFSFRFTTLSKLLHVYTEDEFESIDWNPRSVEYESDKLKILEYDIKRLKSTYDKYREMYDISSFYENEEMQKHIYIEHFDNVIDEVRDYLEEGKIIKYAIWGITQRADMICSYLEKNYPKTQFVAAYDKNKIVEFHGVVSTQDITEICKEEVFVFVTAWTANIYAREMFGKIGKTNYHISTDGVGE